MSARLEIGSSYDCGRKKVNEVSNEKIGSKFVCFDAFIFADCATFLFKNMG